MITLHLGVMDVPYAVNVPAAARRVVARTRNGVTRTHTAAPSGGQTTADVAQILEAKYHIMEVFFEEHADEIADDIAASMADALDHLIDNGTPPGRIFPDAGQDMVRQLFNKFIDGAEIEKIGIPGVPTAAALAGVNHRRKIRKGPRRPSFKDTGVYEQSFRAWVDGE